MITICLLLITLFQTSTLEENRSRAVVRAFQAGDHPIPHPNGWLGHVVDHIIPLCAGGHDEVSNMQWQTASASYRKDGFERSLCTAMQKQGYILTKVAQ